MFHHDKENDNVIFMDNRELSDVLCDGRTLNIHPDVIADFRNMPFGNERFDLVIFDPPHLIQAGSSSWIAKKYGILSKDWRRDIKQGFSECMRVLRGGGTLIFKWGEPQITVSEVIEAIGEKPLIGSRTNKTGIWLVYFKLYNSNHLQKKITETEVE